MSGLTKVLQKLEDNRYGTMRKSYSGRFMFGESCLGFDTDDPDAVREAVVKAGYGMGRLDNMGLGWIVYWPGEEYSDG